MPPPLTQAYESAILLSEFEPEQDEEEIEVATEAGSPPAGSKVLKADIAAMANEGREDDYEKSEEVAEKVVLPAPVAPRKLITCELLPKFDGPVLQFPFMAAATDK